MMCFDTECPCWMTDDPEGFHWWAARWDSMGAEGRDQELAMMDDYEGLNH